MSDVIPEPEDGSPDEGACRRRAVSGAICGIGGVALPIALIGGVLMEFRSWNTGAQGLSDVTWCVLLGGQLVALCLGVVAIVQGVKARRAAGTSRTATSALALGGVTFVFVAAGAGLFAVMWMAECAAIAAGSC